MKDCGASTPAFIFSSILAVVLFYLLASFVLHPDVVNGYVAQAERVEKGLRSPVHHPDLHLLFVLYSIEFVKSRKKEFDCSACWERQKARSVGWS
jgi:putative ABC transport system permease protein